MANFYDEMNITSIDAMIKGRKGGAFVPDGVDLENCDVDSDGFLTDYEVKRQRLDMEAKQQQSNSRRKMTLVNRIL